ncbi:hypothetical protein PSHT_15281 [Puccinia striiformis]|uniref:V-SNARE coiled-coil homology domain-containing protein n=1 Tax=Puccinia striiformis TaxID=27350 RepID=A0A2S4UFX0_9BASI|nr:hypothetical protein PSHT_15281 [Puccinia striiformis]
MKYRKNCDRTMTIGTRNNYTAHAHLRPKLILANPPTYGTAPNLRFNSIDEYLVKYQDPKQADTILKVQQELDETKIVLHKTIESILQRGEKLDTLVEQSNALSSQSRIFNKTAKKQNY